MIKYKRVLLKVSGEALMGDKSFGQDFDTIKRIAEDIKEVVDYGVQVCVVVGGGNIYRGIQGANIGMDRASSDNMGMLATVINALALQNMLESMGVYTRVQSAITMMSICESFIRRRADRHMEKGRVVIFGAGTGNPYFTTDSAAALRAVEMRCDILLKATQVDGVYTADPMIDKNATRLEQVTYDEVLRNNLKVMDMSAIALARENRLPIKVFAIKEKGNFLKVLEGSGLCTTIN
jgi:uridylate kinase